MKCHICGGEYAGFHADHGRDCIVNLREQLGALKGRVNHLEAQLVTVGNGLFESNQEVIYLRGRVDALNDQLAARDADKFGVYVGGVKVGEIPEPSPDGTCNPECAVNVSPWFHGDHWQCGFTWDGTAPRKAENSYYQHSPGESCPRYQGEKP